MTSPHLRNRIKSSIVGKFGRSLLVTDKVSRHLQVYNKFVGLGNFSFLDARRVKL